MIAVAITYFGLLTIGIQRECQSDGFAIAVDNITLCNVRQSITNKQCLRQFEIPEEDGCCEEIMSSNATETYSCSLRIFWT